MSGDFLRVLCLSVSRHSRELALYQNLSSFCTTGNDSSPPSQYDIGLLVRVTPPVSWDGLSLLPVTRVSVLSVSRAVVSSGSHLGALRYGPSQRYTVFTQVIFRVPRP